MMTPTAAQAPAARSLFLSQWLTSRPRRWKYCRSPSMPWLVSIRGASFTSANDVAQSWIRSIFFSSPRSAHWTAKLPERATMERTRAQFNSPINNWSKPTRNVSLLTPNFLKYSKVSENRTSFLVEHRSSRYLWKCLRRQENGPCIS